MDTVFDQEVGSIITEAIDKYVYQAGTDSFGNVYYKSIKTFKEGFKNSRRSCYIPALYRYKKVKDTKEKICIDNFNEPRPELVYTAHDMYRICGGNVRLSFLLISLLRGQIPERYLKYLVDIGLVDFNDKYWSYRSDGIECVDWTGGVYAAMYATTHSNFELDPITRGAGFSVGYLWTPRSTIDTVPESKFSDNLYGNKWFYITKNCVHLGDATYDSGFYRGASYALDINCNEIMSNFRPSYIE